MMGLILVLVTWTAAPHIGFRVEEAMMCLLDIVVACRWQEMMRV